MRSSLVLFLALLVPTSASAFSDPARFAQEPEAGGGGGRYFTGSRADGHACSVCHRGAAPPDVTVGGLPERFEPGRVYELELTWDGDSASHALSLELLTESGRHPDVVIEPERVLKDSSRCDGVPEGDAANYSIDVGERRIVGIRDCGARRLAVQFRAPEEGTLDLSFSVVRTDSSGTATGDGVFDFRRTLRRAASEPSGCSVASRTSFGVPGWLICAVLWLLTQRRSSANINVASSACTRVRPTKAK